MKKNRTPVFDRSILITIAVASFAGLFVMAYKLMTYRDCSNADFIIKGGPLFAGQIVSVKDQTPKAAEWKWDFGDGSAPAAGREALHVFKRPGEYWVTLQVDRGCAVQKKVTIRKDAPLVNFSRYPVFTMPPSARAGEPVAFTDHTAGAEKWQWSFGETMRIDATTKDPTYIFQSSGVKTVTLIVNGDERYAAKKRITVFAAPVEKPEFQLNLPERAELKPEKPDDIISISEMPLGPPLRPVQQRRAPEITRIQLEDYLLQVAAENRKPETLRAFYCDGPATRVRANGEEKTLQTLLEDLKGEKISIGNLELVRHKGSRCINFMKIDYNKRRFLGIF